MDRLSETLFQDSLIHELFEQQAVRTPESIGVQSDGRRLTYRELNERSNQLACFLRKKGVKPSSIVAICFERSIEMIVGMLAVLKAGGAYLPIDPSYPFERLAMLLDDAQPSVLLTQEQLVEKLPRNAAPQVLIDRDWPLVGAEDIANLARTAGRDDIAYVVYTSGSTGRPKGVLVTHHNVVRLFASTHHWFDFGPSDVWSMFHSYAFDFSVWEIWGCLIAGGRLVIVPHCVTRSPVDFYRLLSEEQVTVLNQTPSAFYQIIQVEENGIARPLALRHVVFGGEALNFAKLRPWFKRHSDQSPQLVNMYGITETTVHVTYRQVTAADARDETRSLIGVPIPDLRVYVLDAERRPVAPGVVGEIYVGGAGVSRGYLNRPELTADRFVLDPFAKDSDSRMYKSGDLARGLEDGDIEYLGREDSQIKIHGFRIEIGEVEAALAQVESVLQSAVVARKDGPGEQKLVAYYVARPGCRPTTGGLREFLRTKLPSHMVPYAYVELEAIPLTVNGKVDRAAFPAPTSVADAAVEGAHSEIEQIVMDVWRETLGLDRIGRDENFFDLGGDSILITSVHTKLQQTVRMEFPLTDLFEFTTITTLARHLGGHKSTQPELDEMHQQGQKQRAAFARQRERRAGRVS